MFQISTIQDSHFTEIELPKSVHEGEKVGYKYSLNNLDSYDKEIIIAPHWNESYINLELFKLAIYCKKNKIKLTSLGSMNQLPFFGTFSDEVICLKDTHLHNIYSSNYSSFGTDGSYFKQIPNFVDIYAGGMGMLGFPEANSVSIDEVIETYTFPSIFLRKSTLDYFSSLSLPSDIIYCEVKSHFYPKLTNIIKNNFPDAVGLDKNFQRELLKDAGDHFMGVQLLSSFFNGWQFVAAGGSVNVFSTLPVRPLLFLENNEDLTDDFIKAVSIFAKDRYGAAPKLINFSPRICSNEVLEEQDYSLNGTNQENLVEEIKNSFSIASKRYNTDNIFAVEEPSPRDRLSPHHEAFISNIHFDNEIKIKVNGKVINWIFQYNHDYNFFKKNILDWAIPNYSHTTLEPDFTIGVYINNQDIFNKINDLKSQKFLLSSEAHTRHPVLNNCHSFVQDARPNDDHSYIKYAPTMCCWSPPFSKNQSTINLFSSLKNPPNLCSAIDSGRYSWRKSMVEKFSKSLRGKIDLFGGGYNNNLGGYHHNTNTELLNEKYLSLQPYLFSLGIENDTAVHSKEDYITEKVTDPIMCESIPICHTAPNINDYFVENSYVLFSELNNLDLNNLPFEYNSRRNNLLKQKQYLKTHFNVFSYFNRLTDDLSLLNKIRPITI